MTDTTTTYHQATGYWNRTCSCGRSFKSGRGTQQHGYAESRKRRWAQTCANCGERGVTSRLCRLCRKDATTSAAEVD